MTITLTNPSVHATAAAQSASTPAAGKRRMWTGRILTGFAALFLLVDAGLKLAQLSPAVQGTAELGYPTSVVFPLGLVLLACLVTHLVPRTAVLGAVLLTGYLGGAIATHLRVQSPLLSHTLFPIYVAALIWGGLYLRDSRVRTLISARARSASPS